MTDSQFLGLLIALETLVAVAVWVQTLRVGRQNEKIFGGKAKS
jgi:hypothetical protein